MNKYINLSLELHLFFGRIMKEHALFLEVGFLPKNREYILEAQCYKREFERILLDTVRISNGMIAPNILNSGEIITAYTYDVEEKTKELTGTFIDTNITLLEKNLQSNICPYIPCNISENIYHINNCALQLLDGFIKFKERILHNVLNCTLFTANYPLLIEHIIREAKLYRYYLETLQNTGELYCNDRKQSELFWNQIMMEHALFIRGLLDPSENQLIATADSFANNYRELLEEAINTNDKTMGNMTAKTIAETTKYKEFKEAGTKGIADCKIRSIILPLLADHVLREANHYLRILKDD